MENDTYDYYYEREAEIASDEAEYDDKILKPTNDNGAHSFTEGATFDTSENINEFLKEEKTMKPQFKHEEIYLDLSKLSEEQQRKVIALLPKPKVSNQYQILKLRHFILSFYKDGWWVYGTEIKNKTELTYSQFLDMMGESEEVLQVENYTREDIEKAYRAGEKGATYYFKDTTVILPTTYEGVDG
jgi:hypothetical protein